MKETSKSERLSNARNGTVTKTQGEFECYHCGKKYKREASLFKHSCKERIRKEKMETPQGILAFDLFKEYRWLTMRNKPNLDTFIESRYYNEFLSLAEYLIMKQISKDYVHFLFKESIAFKNWKTVETYKKYLIYRNKNANPYKILEENVMHIDEWCSANHIHLEDFYDYCSTSLITYWITTGKLSPWIALNSDKMIKQLKNFTEEQLNLVADFINPVDWKEKLNTSKAKDIKHALEELGL